MAAEERTVGSARASTLIGGIFPAAMTMFDVAGEVDEAGTARHVEYLLRSGAHAIIAGGTSGEFIALTLEERKRVTRVIVDAVAGRVPVYAGTGHYATRFTIELTQDAEAAGASGAIVIPPYYQKPPKPSIFNHYRAVSKSTRLPLMLYDNPLYAGTQPFTTAEIVGLVDAGVLSAVKSTFESVVPVDDLLAATGDRMRVFYGSFQSPLAALLAGAHGWISGFLNFLTFRCVALFDACQAGDVVGAREQWRTLQPFKHLYTHGSLGEVNDLARRIGTAGRAWRPLPSALRAAHRLLSARFLRVRCGNTGSFDPSPPHAGPFRAYRRC